MHFEFLAFTFRFFSCNSLNDKIEVIQFLLLLVNREIIRLVTLDSEAFSYKVSPRVWIVENQQHFQAAE